MTPKQQRIAIAEACGFKIKDYKMEDGNINVAPLPDYLNNLNAMHEAGKMLKLGMRSLYDANLGLIAERDYCFIWETNAAQRAEAFLKTLGLWEATK